MKIGIITWFTGPNFGTNLQAIALQRYLRNEGYEAEIINYEVVSSYEKDERTVLQRIVMRYAVWRYGRAIAVRNQKIADAVMKNCVFTDKIHNDMELIDVCNTFDLLICGSDQIWNPNWYHRFYFADYDGINTCRISYAPSMGVNVIPNELMAEIRRGIGKFDEISVREEKGAELLAPYIQTNPAVVVDPTLLLGAGEWERIFPDRRKGSQDDYVLSVFLTDRRKHWKAVRSFIKKKNLRHVVIPYCGFSYMQKGDIQAEAGLEDMLELMRGARYVLTDSFHITVFAIIYQKQFYTFQRFQENQFTSQNARVSNLLKMTGLEERFVPFGCKKIKEINDIKYEKYQNSLQEEVGLKSKVKMLIQGIFPVWWAKKDLENQRKELKTDVMG